MDGDQDRPPQRTLPTLDQALPYTPLTSILPFPSQLVQLPDAIIPSQPPSLLSTSEQSSLSHTFNVLNSNVLHFDSSSSTILRTLNDLGNTLDSHSLPQYVISVPPSLNLSGAQHDHGAHPNPTHNQSSVTSFASSTLSPFARMALDASTVSYLLPNMPQIDSDAPATVQNPSFTNYMPTNMQSHPTFAISRSGYSDGQPVSHPEGSHSYHNSPSSTGLPKPTVVIYSGQATKPGSDSSGRLPQQQRFSGTGAVLESPGTFHPSHFDQTAHEHSPFVILPGFPTSSDPSQYQSHPEADQVALMAEVTTPKKRKRDDLQPEQAMLMDQRDLADSAERGFRDLLVNIFEAENQVDHNFELSAANQSQSYFIVDRDSEGGALALLPALLASVDSAATKVIKLRRFTQIPVEQLVHLQRILLASLRLAFEIDLKIPDDLSDDSIDQWTSSLETADNSLRASKLLLSILTSGREEKELYSEEITTEIVNNLQHILETGVLPLVDRSASTASSSFKTIFELNSGPKSTCFSILQRCGRVIKLMGDLIVFKDLSESTVTKIEFLTTRVLFTENPSNDKDSLFGMQRFETFRRHAMDVTSRIFLRYSEQRAFILNEILSSLEKLPITRQSARQFKLPEGKPIQLVSALIMQLVQCSAMPKAKDDAASKKKDKRNKRDVDVSQSDSSESPGHSSEDSPRVPLNKATTNGHSGSQSTTVARLGEISEPVAKSAESNASYIARYLVQRALTSTKTGDQPYRNLLDIFTEDFIHVLNHPEWPAAEILLRALLSSFLGVLGEDKSPAPAKNMALDLMGTIGSEIADVRNTALNAFQTLENSSLKLVEDITSIFEDVLVRNDATSLTHSLHGPYQLLIEFLQQNDKDNLQLQSAKFFFIIQWARSLCSTLSFQEQEGSVELQRQDSRKEEVSRWLLNWTNGANASVLNRQIDLPSRSDTKVCHALILMSLPLCRASDRIFHSFVTALSSPQATVRSRSIKSLSLLLEKDPSILKRSNLIMQRIIQSTSDPSPLVRDSALTLVGKFVAINSELKLEATRTLIANSTDSSIAVRKRAMKLLRDVYLEDAQPAVRTLVADAILRRLNDIEQSIVELASSIMEDMWITPFHGVLVQPNPIPTKARKSVQQQTSLIAATLARGEDVIVSLETFFSHILGPTEKNSSLNQDVCKLFVRNLFESIIDNEQGPETPSQKSCLQTLTIFAKAEPRIFEADQMLTLRPYIDNISFTAEDLPIYRSTIAIYRRVLPVLPPLQNSFLLGVQESLLNTVSKLGRQELEEVAACLWIIDGVLQNTERLSRLLISVLRNIEAADRKSTSTENDTKRLRKLVMLAGAFGKACDFQKQIDLFQNAFPSRKFGSVPSLVVDTINPLASPDRTEIIRDAALDSIGLICQAWPENYVKPHIGQTFHSAFEHGNSRLLLTVLSGFRAFYFDEDNRTKTERGLSSTTDENEAANRLGTSMSVTHNDGAATSIAQQFLPKILKIALSSQGTLALIATDIIASNNRQGLVHPKECGPALVALETSPETVVAKVAFEEHQSLHAKHESMLEKEYVKAVEQAFIYQRDNWSSPGGTDNSLNPKMRSFYEVIKTGSLPLRKKLFTNLCTRLIIDPGKGMVQEELESRILYTRFILENLSLFEYNRADELSHIIATIEKLFSTWGDPLSQRIEALLHLTTTGIPSEVTAADEEQTNSKPILIPEDISKLRLATMQSMVLSMLWQTRLYLRRIWNLHSVRPGRPKSEPKETNKPPTRTANPPVEEHLDKMSQIAAATANDDSMISQCQNFLSLLTVDSDLRIGSEDEADSTRHETPSEDGARAGSEMNSVPPPSGGSRRGRKIRNSSTPISTPRKPGRPSLGGGGNKSLLSQPEGVTNEDDAFMNYQGTLLWN